MWLTMADVGSGKKPRATSFRFNDTHRIGERSTPFVELDGSKRPAPFYSDWDGFDRPTADDPDADLIVGLELKAKRDPRGLGSCASEWRQPL